MPEDKEKTIKSIVKRLKPLVTVENIPSHLQRRPYSMPVSVHRRTYWGCLRSPCICYQS